MRKAFFVFPTVLATMWTPSMNRRKRATLIGLVTPLLAFGVACDSPTPKDPPGYMEQWRRQAIQTHQKNMARHQADQERQRAVEILLAEVQRQERECDARGSNWYWNPALNACHEIADPSTPRVRPLPLPLPPPPPPAPPTAQEIADAVADEICGPIRSIGGC
jgi:hypothetical protein